MIPEAQRNKTSIYREKNSFTATLTRNNSSYIDRRRHYGVRYVKNTPMLTTRMTCMIRPAISYRSRFVRQLTSQFYTEYKHVY